VNNIYAPTPLGCFSHFRKINKKERKKKKNQNIDDVKGHAKFRDTNFFCTKRNEKDKSAQD